MLVNITISEDIITAYLNGEIDHHTAKDIRTQIDEVVERIAPKKLVIDFKDVSFMDSSGIGLLIGRHKLVAVFGGSVHVTGLSSSFLKVMKLAGLDRLMYFDGGK